MAILCKVNAVTQREVYRYPLPCIDTTLDSLAGSSLFIYNFRSYIWLCWQVELEQSDQEKTAFSTTKGHFEFTVMPFWLTNVPATFPRIIGCVHRRSFDDPVKPQRSTTGSMGSLMGTNKAAWGVKLLLMTVSVYQVDCALLNTQHCCLSPCGWYSPSSASHPPPINFIHDIAGVVKNITKTSSVSYVTELVIKL